MSIDHFLKKTSVSLEAAELLIKAENAESVCNRGYYAMFNGARAALVAVGEEKAAYAKTHSGILSNFSRHVAKPGHVEAKWSGVLAQEERRRLLADYESEAIVQADAEDAILHARQFPATIFSLVDSRR